MRVRFHQQPAGVSVSVTQEARGANLVKKKRSITYEMRRFSSAMESPVFQQSQSDLLPLRRFEHLHGDKLGLHIHHAFRKKQGLTEKKPSSVHQIFRTFLDYNVYFAMSTI